MSLLPNYCFPIRVISNERVKLVPFQPDRHAETYFQATAGHPELYSHMPTGPYESKDEFLAVIRDKTDGPNPSWATLAVIDKTKAPSDEDEEGELAGIMSYINSSTANLCTEIGFVVVLPAFHRTHVATNAVGLMMQYALTSPEDGGLGLRRVQWQASSLNKASIRLSERMGFSPVGIIPWERLFEHGQKKHKIGNGRTLPKGGNDDDLWRDTFLGSLGWDAWENGVKEMVQLAMDRKS